MGKSELKSSLACSPCPAPQHWVVSFWRMRWPFLILTKVLKGNFSFSKLTLLLTPNVWRFFPQQPILQLSGHQRGVQRFSSDTIYPELGQALQRIPTPHFPSGLIICWNGSQNSGKHLCTDLLQSLWKRTRVNSQVKKCRGQSPEWSHMQDLLSPRSLGCATLSACGCVN